MLKFYEASLPCDRNSNLINHAFGSKASPFSLLYLITISLLQSEKVSGAFLFKINFKKISCSIDFNQEDGDNFHENFSENLER